MSSLLFFTTASFVRHAGTVKFFVLPETYGKSPERAGGNSTSRAAFRSTISIFNDARVHILRIHGWDAHGAALNAPINIPIYFSMIARHVVCMQANLMAGGDDYGGISGF